MALARTNQIGEMSAEDGVPGDNIYTTASFTPPNNSLLVVGAVVQVDVGSTDISSLMTVAGGSLTFTSRAVIGVTGSYSVNVRVWTAPVTTGASMTLAIDADTTDMWACGVAAVAYTGYDSGAPVGATITKAENAAPDGAQSMTLSGAPATGSEVFVFFAADRSSTGTTPGSTFTELYELQAGGSSGFQVEVRTGSTSTTVDWVDTQSAGTILKYAAAAIEVKAGAGGGAPTYVMRPAVVAP